MGLRFCMLTTFYPPYSFGGDAVGVQRLSRALARRGHHVTVVHDIDAYRVLHRGTEPAAPAPDADGIEVIGLRTRVAALSTLLTQQSGRPLLQGHRIRKIVSDGSYDVINFHNISLVGGPGLLAIGDAVKVYTAHEHWLVCPSHVLWRHGRELCTARQCFRCVLHYRRPPQPWRYTGFLESQLRHVDAFIAKSTFSRDKHHEFGFPRDMEVMPYFLPDDVQETRHGNDQASESPHARPYFLFVGRLERIKGLDDVIPLFARFPDADLLVAGDGEHAEALRGLAAGLPNVHFLGRMDPERLTRLYRHAIAIVVPSVCYETFGIILIEAFRVGTPVIARRLGPLPEIVEACGGGLLFDGEEDLLAAMRRLLAAPAERSRMSEDARRGFCERWSEASVLPVYLGIVRRAAERRGRLDVARRLAAEGAA